jgi:hypothetical protein
MKCSICDQMIESQWYCIAARINTAQVYVMNAHRVCMEKLLGRPVLRRLDGALMFSGWVQESLPLGI